jgi:hypothetical protein
MKNKGLGLGALALALAVGACGVDYTSLGQRPGGSNEGSGAGGGGAGGAPEGPRCAEPNPAGCGENAPCPQGSVCVEVDPSACAPSLCQCSESGEWGCTKDCVAARACVAPPTSVARLGYGCAPNDAPIKGLIIGASERSCSSALAYPLLLLPFGALSYLEGGVPSIEVGQTYNFTKAELEGYAEGVQPFADPSTSPLPYVAGTLRRSESGPAIVLERGSVTVKTWDGGSLMTGSYEVEFADGARLTGTFDADLCRENAVICG